MCKALAVALGKAKSDGIFPGHTEGDEIGASENQREAPSQPFRPSTLTAGLWVPLLRIW